MITKTSNSENFRITVDYTKNLKEMLANAGFSNDYDNPENWINEKNFPFPHNKSVKEEKVVMKLFRFNKHTISATDGKANRELKIRDITAALKKMDTSGYRPATIFELLSFATAYPEAQKQFKIVAIGSFWRNDDVDYLGMPCLGQGFDKRKHLDLTWFDTPWNSKWLFLAARK